MATGRMEILTGDPDLVLPNTSSGNRSTLAWITRKATINSLRARTS